MNIRRKHICELAKRVLLEANLFRAPIDVDLVATRQNARVHRKEAEDKFAGYLFRDAPGGVAVIGVNSRHSIPRQRFTIAHEIGHLLLHAPSSQAPIHFDELFMKRDIRSSEGSDPKEVEANLFAAELLMPSELIERDLASIVRIPASEELLIEQMARHYIVSPHAMGIRLSHLGYV